ncbi:MAG: ThuA domain-containing protein [Planctomycetes bacterium]|nr:ThuA domain-containing protein [Planctomycetota bacterium]
MATQAIILVGSRWHIPWEGGEILSNLLAEEGISSTRTDQGSILEPERLAETDLVVFYCEGRWVGDDPASRRLTPAQEADLVAYVEKGGGFLGVHGATVFREEYALYPEMIGGRFVTHAKFTEFPVRIVDREHPVTQGVEDYTVMDEPYIVDRTTDSDVLLAGVWDGEDHPFGWVKTHGKGRVCYLANGHDRRSLDHPSVQRLLRSAARWCVGAT